MSIASLRVLKGQIDRGAAGLSTIEAWEAKRALSPEEAEEARAYWHRLYDPPPAADPAADSAAADQAPASGD